MTAQEQIAKLESLLARIRRNASAARPVAVHAAPAPAPRAAAVHAAPPPPVIQHVAAPEEVSLESLGATEAQPAAEPIRERVQSADMEELEVVEIGEVEIGEPVSGEATELLEEPVPESAPRAAVQSVEVELEPPIKTPPPESGRQAVTPPPAMAESRAAADDDFDDDDLLEPDLSGSPISIVNPGSPTMAQLGDTVQLDDASTKSEKLELAHPEAKAPPPSASDELEADLPKHEGSAGAYDSALAPPSTAASDLERHREVVPETREVASSRRVDPLAATVPDLRTALSLAKTQPDARSPFADAVRATTEAIVEPPKVETAVEPPKPPIAATAPEVVVERPAIAAAHAAEVIVDKPRKVPETFLELLDDSLSLRA